MAKKKEMVEPRCLHCTGSFLVKVRWCPKCESHVGERFWSGKADVCDRCACGENDWYLSQKVGRVERIQAAVESFSDPANWGDGEPLRKFNEWVDSPAYHRRFEA